MPTLVEEVMSKTPMVLTPDSTIAEAAAYMRDGGIGDVLVIDGDRLVGLVTDRDIVVRAVAEHCDPDATQLSAVCSADLFTVRPDDAVDTAERIMRDRAVRRMPVVKNGRPVGMISLADLTDTIDSAGTLRDISAAPPNT
jgi:CBS domain-containing protein